MFGQHPWHPASASWPVKGWFFPCFSCYPVWSFREKPTRPESFHLHQCLGDFKSSRIQPTSKINWLTIWTFKKSCSDSERWFPVMQITWQKFLHEKSININHFCCHLRFFHSVFCPVAVSIHSEACRTTPAAQTHPSSQLLTDAVGTSTTPGGERWHAFEILRSFYCMGSFFRSRCHGPEVDDLLLWYEEPVLLTTMRSPQMNQHLPSLAKRFRRCIDDVWPMEPPQSLLEKIGCQFFIWKAWPRIQRQVIQHRSHEHDAIGILHETRVPGHAFWHEDKSTAIVSQSYTMQTCVRLDMANTVSLKDLKGYENISVSMWILVCNVSMQIDNIC